jgi:acyl-CoA thioesterase
VPGIVHGGIVATLVDVAALYAMRSQLTATDRPAGTAELGVTYLRPASGKYLDAEATVLRKGRQLVAMDVDILDDERRLCAKAHALYSLRVGAD